MVKYSPQILIDLQLSVSGLKIDTPPFCLSRFREAKMQFYLTQRMWSYSFERHLNSGNKSSCVLIYSSVQFEFSEAFLKRKTCTIVLMTLFFLEAWDYLLESLSIRASFIDYPERKTTGLDSFSVNWLQIRKLSVIFNRTDWFHIGSDNNKHAKK